ncbi:hypothetical protein Tco_0500691 [Tanacetum coccineum]
MGDVNPICTLGDYSKPSHEGYRNTIELPIGNNVLLLRSDTIRLVQNECSFHELWSEDPNQYLKDFLKFVDSLDLDSENRQRTRLQSWALLEDLALYNNERWNDPRDFAKPVKAISLSQDVPSTFDRRLIKLENQVQRLIEAHIAPMKPTQVNKITFSCEICSGPHDTQYCMENPEQAFVEYASSRTDEAGGALHCGTVKNPKLNVNSTSLVLSTRSYPTEDPQCLTHIHGLINTITIHPKQQSDSHEDMPKENKEEEKDNPKNIVTNPSTPPDPSVVLGKPFVEISNMTHDPPEDLEKEHTKSVYLGNEEDKRRGVEYMMCKILGFYKECLELGPEYVTEWMMKEKSKRALYLKRSCVSLEEVSLDILWRKI